MLELLGLQSGNHCWSSPGCSASTMHRLLPDQLRLGLPQLPVLRNSQSDLLLQRRTASRSPWLQTPIARYGISGDRPSDGQSAGAIPGLCSCPAAVRASPQVDEHCATGDGFLYIVRSTREWRRFSDRSSVRCGGLCRGEGACVF